MSVDMDISGPLESMDINRIGEVVQKWQTFCEATYNIVKFEDIGPFEDDFLGSVNGLLEYGLGSLVVDYFLLVLEERCKQIHVPTFWRHFDGYLKFDVSMDSFEERKLIDNWVEETISNSLEELRTAKCLQKKCLSILKHTLQSSLRNEEMKGYDTNLPSRYQSMVSAVLHTTLPRHFPEVLHLYFKARLEEFRAVVENKKKERNLGDCIDGNETETVKSRSSGLIDGTEVDDLNALEADSEYFEVIDNKWISKVGHVVHNLKDLGFTAMTEDAYASAIFSLLNAKVHSLAGEDHLTSVLQPIRNWIQAVPLGFLHIILHHMCLTSQDNNRDQHALASTWASCPPLCITGRESRSERITRWHLRLEYFAYETLQDLRISQLFDIIVDYPESEDTIKDLKQCLDNTGQHAKLVDSFLSALRYRLLIAGASTNDILVQYVSTIKALRTLDPTGVFLEAVGQPIGEYLRGRKDASKCIVAMLTDSSGCGNGTDVNEGISLLEELCRDASNLENGDNDDDFNAEDENPWAASERWEPDPVEADPYMGIRNRRSIDILGILVGMFGSKEQLINEYCIMLAEKLLNISDYKTEHEIRTLELFKKLFGDGSMQRCEIMINDMITSRRINANFKTTLKQQSQHEDQGDRLEESMLSLDIIDATIVSACFWPPFQGENINIPSEIDKLLDDYAKQFHVLRAPRKIMWKKNLGTVKLELQFEDRSAEFVVSPVHATIIMLFQEQLRWTSKDLAAAVGISVDTLCRRIILWVNQGILMESSGTSDEHFYTIVENIGEIGHDVIDTRVVGTAFIEEEEETLEEDQSQTKKLVVYESFVKGMLTNFPTLKLEDIHKRLGEHSHRLYGYDLSLHQLRMFLSHLVSEDKLEVNDGEYRLQKQ